MGVSNACQTFELLSYALQWISQLKFHISSMSHILDDSSWFGKTQPECHSNLSCFLELSQMASPPIKQSKTVLPSTTVTLHGIEVDTLNQTLALPLDKVTSLRQKLLGLAKRKIATLKEMQSLIGSLHFACSTIVQVLTRFNKICHPSQRPRWQVDKEAIGLSRVQQCSSTYSPPS